MSIIKAMAILPKKAATLKFPDKSSIKLDYIKSVRKFWESKV